VTTGDEKPKTSLERAAQVTALFTGVAAIVYIAGGLVLAMRLYFARVTSGAVLGQLPREFLLTIGVGQVLLPVLLLAGAYAGYRLMLGDRARVPSTRRFGHKTNPIVNRLRFLGVSLLVALAIVAPGAGFAVYRRGDIQRDLWWVGVAFAIAVLVALVAVEIRARVTERAEDANVPWSSSRPVREMTALWAAVLVPASIIFWPAFVQLQEAKVCTTSGFEESGELIGQTSNGVYLAETRSREEPRRVATFTAAQTEEVFIGAAAPEATCDPSGLRGAALASRGAADARNDLREATQLLVATRPTSDVYAQANDVRMLAGHVLDVATDAREVAAAADRTTPGVARPIWDAARRAEEVAKNVRANAASDRIENRPEEVAISGLLRDADEAVAAARVAAQAAIRGETAVVEYVRANDR